MDESERKTIMKGLGKRGLLVLVLGWLLAACAGAEPFDYTPSSEIPPGPGVFSGSDGEFTVLRQ